MKRSSPLVANLNGWPLKCEPPRLAKNTPRMPPRTPIGVSIASISGKRSSAFDEGAFVAGELEIFVAAHLGVAAVEEEVGIVAPALEALQAQGEQAAAAEALIPADVAVDDLALQRVADLRRHFIRQPHGAAGERPELAEDRVFLDERQAERHRACRC